jgi:CHAT domain-containing protein/tetratricopeptide (TPR) repeat protein
MQKRWRYFRLIIAAFLSFFISCYISAPQFSTNGSLSFAQALSAEIVPIESVENRSYGSSQLDHSSDQLPNQSIDHWQQLVETYAQQRNPLLQANALNNLALSYQAMSRWENAQAAIAQSLTLLSAQLSHSETQPNLVSAEIWAAIAQTLMTRGSLETALGQPEQALTSWQQAAEAYHNARDEEGHSRAQINQAQALRDLGFYRQALEQLTTVSEALATHPPSLLKAIGLRQLGNALRLNGQFDNADNALTESLRLAEQFENPAEISATLLSLGHNALSQNDAAIAQSFYDQAAEMAQSNPAMAAPSASATPLLSIQLAQLSLAARRQQWSTAALLWPQIQAQFATLSGDRNSIYQQVSWANSLIKLLKAQAANPENWPEAASDNLSNVSSLSPSTDSFANFITDLSTLSTDSPSTQQPNNPPLSPALIDRQLRQALEQARALGEVRAEAHVIGTLGLLYEYNQQWEEAQALTQRALSLSNAINAKDIIYQWQWQLARIWKAPNNPKQSISNALRAYREAIDILTQLRGDLAVAQHNTPFSFSEEIEPIYRQMVSLLLETSPQSPDYSKNLASAQQVIESLRLAELDNYFQEACVDVLAVDIQQSDPKSAILYTLVLEEKLAVILHLPNQPLQYFSTAVPATRVNEVAQQLRQTLVTRSRRDYFAPSQQLYQWLVEPTRQAIDNSGVETLVFVLDGPLQNVPMAALHDGDRFLIEDYAIALTPSLKLLNSKPWNNHNTDALVAGITESRQGQAPLPYVNQEIENIERYIENRNILLNQQFTQKALSDRLRAKAYPIVHVATHGQFGSQPDDTYLMAWDTFIPVRQVSQMLQANLGNREGIALLILSACETASGDQNAALGLAGVAIKAGARSTIGTLWTINDAATSDFVGHLYEQLTQPESSRASALRTAQLQMIQNPQYRHPFYWAPYVLIGSWL